MDNIRSSTPEALVFVKAMTDRGTSAQVSSFCFHYCAISLIFSAMNRSNTVYVPLNSHSFQEKMEKLRAAVDAQSKITVLVREYLTSVLLVLSYVC